MVNESQLLTTDMQKNVACTTELDLRRWWTEEDASATRSELSFLDCDTVGQHHTVCPILPPPR